jgi:hypothetical protein
MWPFYVGLDQENLQIWANNLQWDARKAGTGANVGQPTVSGWQ